MSRSIYLHLAVLLVKADLKREERVWKRKLRRTVHDIPWHNAHLLRDIGLETDGRTIGFTEPHHVTVERRIRHLRRVHRSRIVT
ncbi:DUF1127 domain-containing protein [Vibrio algarum]|uniref:DUF1127 domain-containing protein n=1 Tax=Vibrio algarum TaxID=3020714 RepID=A0ABT4YND3_9VIBR|nr:DUF1127 domain-containing protein [Vibrio sp. KJ40-1]MDB1123054.1 DUF1127 domain-containing protein [Vibrio sp. KJ40-1]